MPDEIAHQPRIKFSWLVGTLAVFSIFGIFGVYSKRMARDYPTYDQDRAQQRYITLAKVQKTENDLLYPPTVTWVDQAKGTVHISIDEAMAKEVDTLKAQPPAIGQEIPGTAPAPAPAATTNAAPAKPGAPASTNAAPAKPSAPPAKPKT